MKLGHPRFLRQPPRQINGVPTARKLGARDDSGLEAEPNQRLRWTFEGNVLNGRVPIDRRTLLGCGVLGGLSLSNALCPTIAQAASHRHARRRTARHKATPDRRPVVVLDPGHGGKDPGSIGVSGIFEKTVTLATALATAHVLHARGSCRVLLTRNRDIFIPLVDRVTFAQRNKATLFMSMHANSTSDHAIRGASVYTLSNRASDPLSAAMAQSENAADRIGGPHFSRYPHAVARILSSLVREETHRGSIHLQEDVIQELGAYHVRLLTDPARHAHFMVLKAADIPSVLVEMGFMSNRADETLLRQSKHRRVLAEAMAAAVENWLKARETLGPAMG